MSRKIIGTYSATPKGTYTGTTSKGTPFVAVSLTVTDRWNGSDYESIDPIAVETRIYLTDKSWDIGADRLAKVGFGGDFRKPAIDVSKAVLLECFEEEYQGKMHTRWEIVLDGGSEMNMDEATANIFTAKWRQTMAPRSSAPVPRSRPTRRETAPETSVVEPVSEEDIPF